MQSALSMSRPAETQLSAEAAEVARHVRLALAGDSAAFEHIVLRYETRVMSLAARLLGGKDEARDVAQEVFLRAFKYLHRLDLRKPIEPWLIRITVNVCRDQARARQRRHDTFSDGEPPEAIDRAPDPHAGLIQKQERLLLHRALGELPEKERLAIVLRDVEGLSTAEVASILGSSETTVRSQVSRGRLHLRAAIHRLTGGARCGPR
jgi:RNA polymerase sigma-70 factor (ECF subfamily)